MVSEFPARTAPAPRSMQPRHPDRLFPTRPANSPAYCTELTLDELPEALAAADRVKDAATRDSLPERFAALPADPTVDDVVEMNRAAHR